MESAEQIEKVESNLEGGSKKKTNTIYNIKDLVWFNIY